SSVRVALGILDFGSFDSGSLMYSLNQASSCFEPTPSSGPPIFAIGPATPPILWQVLHFFSYTPWPSTAQTALERTNTAAAPRIIYFMTTSFWNFVYSRKQARQDAPGPRICNPCPHETACIRRT